MKSPRCEDEEARLCRSAETAQQTLTIQPPPPPPWVFKKEDQGTRDLSEVCTVKEVSPLVVANNRPLSQVQQQQV